MNTRWWPAALVVTVVVTFSLVPLGGGPGTGVGSGAVAGVGLDKLLHVVDYAAIAFALGYAIRARTRTAYLGVFVAAVAVGGAVELLQAPLATRTASVTDAVANTLGAGLGVVGWWILGVVRPRQPHVEGE